MSKLSPFILLESQLPCGMEDNHIHVNFSKLILDVVKHSNILKLVAIHETLIYIFSNVCCIYVGNNKVISSDAK